MTDQRFLKHRDRSEIAANLLCYETCQMSYSYVVKWNEIKGWNVIISKDRAQKVKETDSIPIPTAAAAAVAIADEWNVRDRPYQALS